jgi:hypothetical protein
VYKPSFPGYRWEADHVCKALHESLLKASRSEPFKFSCHTYWNDVVWKAIHRLVVLKVIKAGFEHEQSQETDGITTFVLSRCDSESDLAPERLADLVRNEIARVTTSERAEQSYVELMQRLPPAALPWRLTLCSAMLLKTTYQVVYETRITSLDWLRRYANHPDASGRRQLLDDYFAPSRLKRDLTDLCIQKVTIEVLQKALALLDAGDAPRAAMLGRAATEYPGALVPNFLLALLALKSDRTLEAAQYAMPILAGEEFTLEIRLWCLDELLSTADRHATRPQLLNYLGRIISGAPTLTAIDVLMCRLNDEDGSTELGHVVVEDFISRSLGDRK